MRKDLVVQKVQALGGARRRREAHRTAVAVGVRRMVHARHERSELVALHGLARRQRQRAERAPVKAAEEGDDVRPARGVAGELDARLDRFGARVAEKRPPTAVAVERRQPGDLLSQPHLRLVVEIRARHVDELAGLLRDGADDVGVGVAGGVDGDAGGAVQKEIAVHILDRRPPRALDDERVATRIGRRYGTAVALDERSGLGTRERGFDFRDAHTQLRS